MKILVFSPYYPPHIGGLESHSDEFNKYLSRKGTSIVVFTPQIPETALQLEKKYDNVSIIRFPAFEIIPNFPFPKIWSFRFWKLFFSLFNHDFDIVLSRTRFFSTSMIALVYSKITRTTWVHIEHGSDFVKLNSGLKSAIAKAYDLTCGKIILKFSDLNIANSRASSIFCNKLSGGRKCEIIYRGVEIEKINQADPNLELKEAYKDKVIITYLGRLIDGKGVHDLLKAFSEIKRQDIVLFIIGEGPQRNNLEKLSSELGIREKVIFWGHRNFEEAISVLKVSDIFVNPSYTEGLPTSVIEAALCKIAVVATNVGGTPEISENIEKHLIQPRDIIALKERIELLVDNIDLRKKDGQMNFHEVSSKFDWSENIQRYIETFSRLKKQKESSRNLR